jgi:hypothetical protein
MCTRNLDRKRQQRGKGCWRQPAENNYPFHRLQLLKENYWLFFPIFTQIIKLSEARRTEFLVGKPCRRAYLSEALSDAQLPVEAQTNCIASIDEDSSFLSLFPVEATGALRAASNHS